MKTYNHVYKTDEKLIHFIKETGCTADDQLVVRIHSAIHTYEQINELVSLIKEYLPSAEIVGCSTSCIINNGKLIYDACLISITKLLEGQSFSNKVSCIDEHGMLREGKDIANSIISALPDDSGDSKAYFILIFFPLFYSKIDAVIEEINAQNKKLFLLGGTAYLPDESEEEKPYVIGTDGASHLDVSFLVTHDPNGTAYSDYACGIESVGKESTMRSKGTNILTVDNTPAAEWYSSLLGKEALDKNPSMSMSFPFIIKGRDRNIPYHVDYIPTEKTLGSLGEIPDHSKITPGYFHPQKIYEEVCDVINNISNNPCESIFVYDCVARSSILTNCANWELECFKTTNMSGCLLSGEIITRKGINFYANYTFVLTSISENPNSRVKIDTPDISIINKLQDDNIDALNFLLVNSTRSLNEELNYQQNIIKDAIFYNPAVGIDNQLKFQYDHDTNMLDKVALFYLNNEKMLNLFSGLSETYGYLTDCYQKLIKNFYTQDLFIYSYQDTSLLVATNHRVKKDVFETMVDNIQDFLNSQIYNEIRLNYTAITLFDSEDPLSELTVALDYATTNQITRVRFDEIEDDLKKEQENIQVLLTIREALSHDRVVPYFQEIHSNRPGKRKLYESLMRISDETGKIYFPDKFLPISKQYSLYNLLSEKMVETVLDMFSDSDSRVTINLSIQDIYNRNMLKMIFEKMAYTNHPDNFVFEIVESEEVKDYEYIKSFADMIHELGGKIAIDDFGSGYSNMLNLMRIDADYIKIDGNVIKEITSDPLVRDFVYFMQSWCEKNNQAMICEYIENEEIQKIVDEIGVAYSQGYYYSKPKPWDEVTK